MEFFDTTDHDSFDKQMNQTSEKKSISNEKYSREFIEQNSEGIFRIDLDPPIAVSAEIGEQCAQFVGRGIIGEFNETFSNNFKLFSDKELAGLPVSEINTVFDFLNNQQIRRFFESNFKTDAFEIVQTDRNGSQKHFSIKLLGIVKDAELVCVWGVQHEITAQKSAQQNTLDYEKYWQQTQKIEALGRLAGGIAHDFNNFLAILMLHNDMLNLQLPANSPLRRRIEEMKTATQSASSMVKQLLAIGRKQTLHPKPTGLNGVVNEFSKILPTIVNGDIEIVVDLDPDLGICFVDQNQLVQTLVNLAANAREAMPEGGILKIETRNVVLDKNSVQHKSQSEGSFVQITVSDDGTGMDSTTLESVFEPFFSTKNSSKSVGLGLATAYGFVKQSKGFIWVESDLNRGTAFTIQFPRID